MADNWWDSSSRTRPCLDSVSVTSSIDLFQDTHDHTTTAAATTTATATATTSLHMMGLGLSSQSLPQSLDWNQALLRGDQKSNQSGYRNLLQDQDNNLSSNTNTFQLENNQWRSQKMYSANSQDSASDFKQINVVRGFQLDQPMHDSDNESIITCQGLNSSFQSMDLYGSPASTIMQSLFGSDNNNQQQDSGFDQNQGMSYSLYQSSYGSMNMPGGGGGEFAINAHPKVQLPIADIGGNQLHFSNNARFWNASGGGVNDIRSGFFPSLQMQLPSSSFEDKPKVTKPANPNEKELGFQ
ncbi:hypothetical protein Ccrd_019468 [Cynara cardunculus var. scolymus]|uniref:Uncharacterized protein n=1 Tax=Cynara cardunculus var. scolymus TaxID=59895 RepID=A0A118K129_CYNCS|nr:hypothetical protein Ccrd_019468 [Cynara cardunculus var. scolymus]